MRYENEGIIEQTLLLRSDFLSKGCILIRHMLAVNEI